MANYFSLFVHPFLYFFSPGLSALTSSIVSGDPDELTSWAGRQKDVGVSVSHSAQKVAEHAKWLTDVWESDAGHRARDATYDVAKGLEAHGGEIGRYAGTGLQLGNDFKHLIDTVENGQTIAEGVVKALASIPFVGHGLATAYAATTYAWTGMCCVQLVHIGKDIADLVSEIQDDNVQKSYTPPAATAKA